MRQTALALATLAAGAAAASGLECLAGLGYAPGPDEDWIWLREDASLFGKSTAVCEAGQYCRLQSFDPDTLTAMGSTTSTYTLTLGSCAGGGVDGDTTTCSNGVVVDAAGQAVNVSTLDTQVLTESEYAALSDIEYVVDTATGHIKTEKVEDEEGERTVREVAYDAEVHGPKCDGEGKPSGCTQTTSARQRAAKVLSTTSLLCCGDDLCNSASRTGSLGAAGLAIAAAAMAGFALQTTRV